MAKQRYIDTRFWHDTFIREKLNPLDRYLFLYFLTNDKTNICGIYELPIDIISFETGIEKEMLKKMFKRLIGKIYYVDGWIYIKNFEKYQAVNESIKKGIEIAKKEIPKKIMTKIEELRQGGYRVGTASPQTPPYPNTNPNTNTNTISKEIGTIVKPAFYGNEDINTIMDFLKEKLGGSLDGGQKENRRFAYLLLNKFKKDYPDKKPVELICLLIEAGLTDNFHGKNMTNFKYLFYNAQKIIQSVKGRQNNKIKL